LLVTPATPGELDRSNEGLDTMVVVVVVVVVVVMLAVGDSDDAGDAGDAGNVGGVCNADDGEVLDSVPVGAMPVTTAPLLCSC
jgi:hypothetical protein